MAEMGYVLSSEEMSPNDMVRNAKRAEEAGFTTAWVSDHFHPWIDEQGQSPFVWSVIGGIAATKACYELGQKSHRNADSTVGLVPLRFAFPAFLRRF